MKRAGIVLALGLCILPAAHGELMLPLPPEIEHALTPIDSIPTKQDLEGSAVFGSSDQALTSLVQIVENKDLKFGVRLRAIRALPHYCPAGACAGTPAHATLVALITNASPDDHPEHPGRFVLELRAAIEALGAARSGDPDDVSLLVSFLSSPSRDLRAATARALRDICDPAAIPPLRARRQVEEGPSGVPQVLEAIADALRDLDQCSP